MLYITCEGIKRGLSIPCHTPRENMAQLIQYAIDETGARVVTLQADGDELLAIIDALNGEGVS